MPGLAEEDHPDLTSHVKGGEEGGDGQQPVNSCEMQAGIQKNFILRPEAREGENPSQRQRTDHVQPEGDRHGLAKSAHVAHVTWVKDFVMFFVTFYFFLFTLLDLHDEHVPRDDVHAPDPG